VFNHFESKEALFFDGRTPWVESVVASVTQRAADADPVTALRSYRADELIRPMDEESRPENRNHLEVLDRSRSLRVRERSLGDVEHCVRGPAGTLLDQQR
jgi:hypothetical protein